MFDSIPVTANGTTYKVPPMCLAIMFKYNDLIKDIGKALEMTLLEYTAHISPVVLETLQQNHPELTKEQFENDFDPMTLASTLEVILRQSGFRPLTKGEKLAEPLPSPTELNA